MIRQFDDLFNEFFNRRKYTTIQNQAHDDLKKIIEAIMSFKQIESNNNLGESIQHELGEPNEIVEHVEDGILYKKLIWNTTHGKFVKIIVTDVPKDLQEKNLTIEDRLQKAVEEEDYELAIKLRDEIKRRNAEKEAEKIINNNKKRVSKTKK